MKRPEQTTPWTYGYDGADRLVEVIDPLANSTKLRLRQERQPHAQTDAKRPTTPSSTTSSTGSTTKIYPGGAREEYKYDANGNTDRAQGREGADDHLRLRRARTARSRAAYPLPAPATGDDLAVDRHDLRRPTATR